MAGNSESQTTEWKLPQFLESSLIEDWVRRLPPTTTTVLLRLGAWDGIGPFADARLQGALCLLHRKRIKTSAYVPPITFTCGRDQAVFRPPIPLAGPSTHRTPTERRLAGSIAGLVIGQLCTFDEDHQDIPRLQLTTLKERAYLYGSGSELALAVPVEANPTGTPRKPTHIRASIFNNRLRDLLGPFGVSSRRTPPDWFADLKTFAFEASENTWDHGRLDFSAHPIASIRFVRIKRLVVGKWGHDLAKVAPGFEDEFRKYLRALKAAKDLSGRWSPDGGRLVEVTIADGGVGIAAKMAGSFDVFDGSIETERKYVLNALKLGGTSKRASEPGRGQGFRKMLQVCSRRSGFMLVRSGRIAFSRTYRKLDGSTETVDFNDADSMGYIPRINEDDLPLLAGTSVSMVFPIDDLIYAAKREQS